MDDSTETFIRASFPTTTTTAKPITGWEVDNRDLGIIIACGLVTLVVILMIIWCSYYERNLKRRQMKKRRLSRIPELHKSYDEISINTLQQDHFENSSHNVLIDTDQNVPVVDANHNNNAGKDNKGYVMDEEDEDESIRTPSAAYLTVLPSLPLAEGETDEEKRARKHTSSMSEEEHAAIDNLNELIASCEQIAQSPQRAQSAQANANQTGDGYTARVVDKQDHRNSNGGVVNHSRANGDIMDSQRSSENYPDVIPQVVVTHADVH